MGCGAGRLLVGWRDAPATGQTVRKETGHMRELMQDRPPPVDTIIAKAAPIRGARQRLTRINVPGRGSGQ